MITRPDELAMWVPTKAAFIALAATLSARQREKLHTILCGLAKNRAEQNDLRSANFLYDLAGCEYVEEEEENRLKIIVDNTK